MVPDGEGPCRGSAGARGPEGPAGVIGNHPIVLEASRRLGVGCHRNCRASRAAVVCLRDAPAAALR